jgi:hypothetical protein
MTVMKRAMLACIFTFGLVIGILMAAVEVATGAQAQTVAVPVMGAVACVWLLLRVLEDPRG